MSQQAHDASVEYALLDIVAVARRQPEWAQGYRILRLQGDRAIHSRPSNSPHICALDVGYSALLGTAEMCVRRTRYAGQTFLLSLLAVRDIVRQKDDKR